MRSTRSSKAKKEQMKVGNSGLSKHQRVSKSLSRISSLKRVRTLKRRNKYVQSPTCSSTLKEMKFPTKLILDPGATEAKLLKTQKVRPFTPVQDQAAFKWSYKGSDYLEECNSVTVEVDESFGESLDMELKERKTSGTWPDNKAKVLGQSENGDDYLKVVLGDKLGEQRFEEPIVLEAEDHTTSALENEIAKEDSSFAHDATICYTNPEVKSTDEQGGSFSDLVSELTEGRDEFEETETKNDAEQKENVDLSNDHSITDWKSIQTGLPSLGYLVSSIKEDSKTVNSSEQREAGNGAEQKRTNKFILEICTSKDQNGINTVKLNPNKNSFEVQATEVDDMSSTVEIDVFPVARYRIALTKHSCNKFKRSKRYKKSDEKSTKAREFSPQARNFLPVEPDPQAERVVLRHQETDERRSAEEWMLDYALQKVVNQLASARTRNVALLVEAFETVFPKSNFEPHSRRK
ncbi:hypothetical protein Cgig2_000172 [Carnegiea gigantea]|uniref:Calmodulin-binding domain-containing protein n=1 Tax=Carnegiea gigantea TaxID=171969 RepID=A0A9Q1QMT8_9CARY|nr:hypothetical protein Cgig2_000172 [Carnegiea gigantea]